MKSRGIRPGAGALLPVGLALVVTAELAACNRAASGQPVHTCSRSNCGFNWPLGVRQTSAATVGSQISAGTV